MGTGPEGCKTMKNRRIKEMNKILSTLGLAVLGVAILVGAAGADDMAITAQNEAVTEVTVSPSSISTWALTPGVANTYGSATSFTLNSNDADGAKVEVKETGSAPNTADGKMYSTTATDTLDNALVLKSGTSTITQRTLSEANQQIYGTSAAGTSGAIDFDYEQTVGWADPVATDYAITVTFTATAP